MADKKHQRSVDSFDRATLLERKKLYDRLFDQLGMSQEGRYYPNRDPGIIEQIASVASERDKIPVTSSMTAGGVLGHGVTVKGDKTTGLHYGNPVEMVYPRDEWRISFPSLYNLARGYKAANREGPEWYENPDKYWGGMPVSRLSFRPLEDPGATGTYYWNDQSIDIARHAPDPFGTMLHELAHFKQHARGNPTLSDPWKKVYDETYSVQKAMNASIKEKEKAKQEIYELEKTAVPSAHRYTGQKDFSEMGSELYRLRASQPGDRPIQSQTFYKEGIKKK